MGTGSCFPGGEATGAETDHSPPCSAEVNNGGAIPSLPHTSPWRGAELIKHRDNFTFLLLHCFVVETVLENVHLENEGDDG
jgi:hypothetical protein